jgi:hypothetical protein
MSPAEKTADALRNWMDHEKIPSPKQVELSKLIAAYVAASVKADRKHRSLFGLVFGDTA